MTTNCLNCDKPLNDKYCSGCGQQADTHRISFKNFVFHDLLHGTFHIERGMLFTARQALFRPGKAALDYISGKRKRYYNVFYLVLLTIGLMLFIRHVDELFTTDPSAIAEHMPGANEATRRLDDIFSHKSKIILLLFVPFAALNSFILFRRKKLNLSEHFILSGMILLGILLINTFANVVFLVNQLFLVSYMLLSVLTGALVVFYIGYGYYNAFGTDYSKLGISYRLVLFFAFICLELLALLLVLIGIVTDWKFGQITIAPFG
ncbi:MAG: DUF3667 domain-containing protein [Flavobacterium sp.]|nr:MAG: DUF3667 domain-containing protein [Flavobacterium sp.]